MNDKPQPNHDLFDSCILPGAYRHTDPSCCIFASAVNDNLVVPGHARHRYFNPGCRAANNDNHDRSDELDQFYTKRVIASLLYGVFRTLYDPKRYQMVDPSAGDGAFYSILPPGTLGIDRDPKYPGIFAADFLDQPLSSWLGQGNPVAIIGNPPFGCAANMAVRFFKHAACCADVEVIALILPPSVRKPGIQNRFDHDFHLVCDMPVPKNAYIFRGQDHDVPTVFQIWQRRATVRSAPCQRPTRTSASQGRETPTSQSGATAITPVKSAARTSTTRMRSISSAGGCEPEWQVSTSRHSMRTFQGRAACPRERSSWPILGVSGTDRNRDDTRRPAKARSIPETAGHREQTQPAAVAQATVEEDFVRSSECSPKDEMKSGEGRLYGAPNSCQDEFVVNDREGLTGTNDVPASPAGGDAEAVGAVLLKVIRRMKFGSGCQRRAYAKDSTMFLPMLDEQERHQSLIDDRNGLYLLFADMHEVGLGRPFTPHWVREMADRRTLEAATRWFARRRDRWQAWGALAQAVGHAAFDRHIATLLAADPLETVVGTILHIADDPCEILLGEMLEGPHGTRQEVLYRHRFASGAARGRFCAWANDARNFKRIDAIVALGYQKGAVAVAAAIDQVVSEEPADDGCRTFAGRGR